MIYESENHVNHMKEKVWCYDNTILGPKFLYRILQCY